MSILRPDPQWDYCNPGDAPGLLENPPARVIDRFRVLVDWTRVSTRDRALVRLLLDLLDLIDATGSEVDASWFDWACAAANDVRSYLVGKGILL